MTAPSPKPAPIAKTALTPKTALILGWGGVLPFIGAAAVKIWGSPIMAIYALSLGTVYAGVIITFIGALHWAGAVADHRPWRFIWSVMPALAVVPVLMLAPALRSPFLMIGLLICWGVDVYAHRLKIWPDWFMRLRHGLTSVAVLSLMILHFA